jgi:hypothetical protein
MMEGMKASLLGGGGVAVRQRGIGSQSQAGIGCQAPCVFWNSAM